MNSWRNIPKCKRGGVSACVSAWKRILRDSVAVVVAGVNSLSGSEIFPGFAYF